MMDVEKYEKFGDKILKKSKEAVKELELDERIAIITKEGYGEIGLCGLNPDSFVSGFMYIVSLIIGERRTQKEISEAVGSSTVTIRNAYRKIFDEHPDFSLEYSPKGFNILINENKGIGEKLSKVREEKKISNEISEIEKDIEELEPRLESKKDRLKELKGRENDG